MFPRLRDQKNMDELKAYSVKKKESFRIGKLYEAIPPSPNFLSTRYAEQIKQCGSFLKFAECKPDNYLKLVYANFCRGRFCPGCMERKAMKNAFTLLHALHLAQAEQKARFIFGTFTFPNCQDDELPAYISRLSYSFRKMLNYAAVRRPTLGSYRVIECNYNSQRDDYNLHLHAVFALKPSYFTRQYIKHGDWLEMWKRAFQDDSITQVHIQAIKEDEVERSAFEIGKYLVKSGDFQRPEILEVFHKSFHNRRLHSSTGLIKKLLKRVGEQPEGIASEDGSVIADNLCPECHQSLQLLYYRWMNGEYKNLILKGGEKS